MKCKTLSGFTALIVAVVLVCAACSGPNDGGGPPSNGGGAPTIRIMRSSSTSTVFNYQVINHDGTVTYTTHIGEGGAIGTWSGSTATVTSGLNAHNFTTLTVRAVKDGETVTSTLPGMLKYAGNADDVDISGYNDLFKFLSPTLNSLRVLDINLGGHPDWNNSLNEYRNAINGFIDNLLQVDLSYVKSLDSNAAMAVVLKNYGDIMQNLIDAGNQTEAINTINQVLPRIWFNADGLMNTANRNSLDLIMLNRIKTDHPRVNEVN